MGKYYGNYGNMFNIMEIYHGISPANNVYMGLSENSEFYPKVNDGAEHNIFLVGEGYTYMEFMCNPCQEKSTINAEGNISGCWAPEIGPERP
jgi:hypothetical protein